MLEIAPRQSYIQVTVIALSRKVDYALISLAHLVQNRDQTVSARQIAQTHALPLPLLMKILKTLHQQGILNSTRGVKGGYQIAIDLDELSLGRLIAILNANGATQSQAAPAPSRLSLQPPVQALQYRLIRFLQDVKVTDLVKPGRRIDVPLERVRTPVNRIPDPIKASA